MQKQKYFKTIIIATLFGSQLVGCGQSKNLNPLEKNQEQISDDIEGGNPQQDPNAGADVGTPTPDPVGETPESPQPPSTEFRLDLEVTKFKSRYGDIGVVNKNTDNKGLGDSELYGTRNFRVVLHGVMYRGGANNRYLSPPRSNVNPLPRVGLENLCKEDFSTAVYLYSENFSSAPKSVKCRNTSHQEQTLQYKQYAAAGEKEKILELVYNRIKGKLNGPVYAHCWNGWHSSGLISGIALKQFCGWSDAQADAYWVKNTDGNSSGFETIRKRLKDFKPLSKFAITAAEKKLICP